MNVFTRQNATHQTRRETTTTRTKKKCDTFSICACHPCAGAMLIFSVSFQFLRMTRCDPGSDDTQIHIHLFKQS